MIASISLQAIDMFMARHDWDRVHELAEKQGPDIAAQYGEPWGPDTGCTLCHGCFILLCSSILTMVAATLWFSSLSVGVNAAFTRYTNQPLTRLQQCCTAAVRHAELCFKQGDYGEAANVRCIGLFFVPCLSYAT